MHSTGPRRKRRDQKTGPNFEGHGKGFRHHIIMFVISLVFSTLISVSYLVQVLSRQSTRAFSSCSSSAWPSVSSANRILVIFLPPMPTFPSFLSELQTWSVREKCWRGWVTEVILALLRPLNRNSRSKARMTSHHWVALWQGYKCSPDGWQHGRMVPFQSPRTEHLSSPPLLSWLPPESFCLLSCILLLLLLHSASSSNVHHKNRENLWWPTAFPATFFPKYLSGCISHCCIVDGNHGIDVHVLISQSNEWCKFWTYRRLKSASHIWVHQLLKIKP